MWRHIWLLGLISLFVATAVAQWRGNPSIDAMSTPGNRSSGVVRGQISSDNPFVGSLTVELFSPQHAGAVSTNLEPDGRFEFHGVAPGQYQLRLTGAAGAVVYQELVFISGDNQTLSVQMPTRPKVARSSEATVSIRQLQHKVPAEAKKEFSKGAAASTKQDETNALDHFQKAVKLDPEYADAFNGIGITYAALGQLQQAADQFQKAIDLVPDHSGAAANLSIVLCKLEHYHDAGEMARRALKLDPGLLKIRYVLGISLVTEGKNKEEALDNLQRAASEIPKAHLLAAKLLAESDRRQDAVKHLEEYLRLSPEDGVGRQQVEEWLVKLRQ